MDSVGCVFVYRRIGLVLMFCCSFGFQDGVFLVWKLAMSINYKVLCRISDEVT